MSYLNRVEPRVAEDSRRASISRVAASAARRRHRLLFQRLPWNGERAAGRRGAQAREARRLGRFAPSGRAQSRTLAARGGACELARARTSVALFLGISRRRGSDSGAGGSGREDLLRSREPCVARGRDSPFEQAARDLRARDAAAARSRRIGARRQRDALRDGAATRSTRSPCFGNSTTKTCCSLTKRTRWASPARKEPASHDIWRIRACWSSARSRRRSAGSAASSPDHPPRSSCFVNRARSFIFDTALPPALALAARIALHITRGAEDRRARLNANAARLRLALGDCG